MDCVAIITGYIFSLLVEPVLSFLQNQSTVRVRNLINLGKNAGTLDQEMKQLEHLREDLVWRVELQERRPNMKRTRQVAGWIGSVEALEDEIGDFLVSFEGRRTCLEACSFESVCSNSELGQKAASLLERVSKLTSEIGSLGGELVMEAPPDAVVAVPSSASRIVGGEKIRSTIQSYLEDDEVGIIGIYGMGGVGKSTYLTEINNNFLEAKSKAFEVVIWVTVSRDANSLKIQEDIGARLGFSRQHGQGTELPSDENDRRVALYQALSSKKFLLLLDDVWETLNLEKIGIPRQTKGKVVFTTRLKKVCYEMDAREIEVNCLDEVDSWELFCLKVGAGVDLKNNTPLRPSAKKVVRRCKGLPLALITVGHAMAGATTMDRWEDAVESLRESAEEVGDMEEKVFSVLKFSYDKLNDDSLRECLLYCSLYPEDDLINSEELIEHWVGEGFLDQKHAFSLDRARRRGRRVIDSLMAACLLESAGVQLVKMHDVVRDMALWLTKGIKPGDEMSTYVVDHSGEGSNQIQSIDRWERAKRISLMRNCEEVVKLPVQVPACMNLRTLLIKRRGFSNIVVPHGFAFQSMPALRVLDLSSAGVAELPKEIGSLVELVYLNLKGTPVRSLPKELGNLVKLRLLNLAETYSLVRIPGEAILRLTQLQMLNLVESEYSVSWESLTETGVDDDREITLEGMESSLVRLEEFGIGMRTIESLEKLATSDRLSKCTRFLRLSDILDLRDSHLSRALERLEDLRELEVWDCPNLKSLELASPLKTRILAPSECLLLRLRKLRLTRCSVVKDVTWIQYLSCLEEVVFAKCDGLEELLRTERGDEGEARSSGTEDNTFPSLKSMYLFFLPSLKIISEHPLLLPSLEKLCVQQCPQLKKLPLGTHSAKKLCKITGEQEWWDELEWGQDSGTKDIFLCHFENWTAIPFR